jgi:UDP-N-acetylmuramoylalanine--D-glutamate ligase
MDQQEKIAERIHSLHNPKVSFQTEEHKELFFSSCDYILVSTGIDIRAYYATYKEKWLNELDLFADDWKKPIIAITGTVGKTSTVSFLSALLQQHQYAIATGGNIGIATFDMLSTQKEMDYAVLEVSSFQLEHCASFAPDLAILTNFYPNHLDRHGSEQDYFDAKYNMFAHQNNHQKALIPFTLYEQFINKNYSLFTR